ncbi:MAG: hypothetical protein ACLQVD_21215 [Capsulimonadaceae bacterium]
MFHTKLLKCIFALACLTVVLTGGKPAVAAPPPPSYVVANPGNSQIEISWAYSAGATSYDVFRGTASGQEGLFADGITTTSYDDVYATNGVTYYYKITAVSNGQQSVSSPEVSASPGLMQLTATPGNGSIALSWPSVAGTTVYYIYKATQPGGEVQTYVTGGTSYTDTNVTNGITYYYYVKPYRYPSGFTGVSSQAIATAG